MICAVGVCIGDVPVAFMLGHYWFRLHAYSMQSRLSGSIENDLHDLCMTFEPESFNSRVCRPKFLSAMRIEPQIFRSLYRRSNQLSYRGIYSTKNLKQRTAFKSV